jgi:TRAP-type C4-dicarboxylate transport system permease small subunit
MEIYRRTLDQVEKVQSLLITLLYVLIILVVSFQVLNRFILQWPVLWTADAAVICFVWLGFLCASQSVRKSAHFRMTILIERKWKGCGRRVLELLSLLVILGLSAVLFVQGLVITTEGLKEISPGLTVSMAWAYAAIPVASFTSLLFGIEKLIEQIQGRVPDPVTFVEETA